MNSECKREEEEKEEEENTGKVKELQELKIGTVKKFRGQVWKSPLAKTFPGPFNSDVLNSTNQFFCEFGKLKLLIIYVCNDVLMYYIRNVTIKIQICFVLLYQSISYQNQYNIF